MNSRRLVPMFPKLALAAIAACVSFTVVSPSAPAGAVGAATLYVAASGSVGAGTSCASPGYVGSTEAKIQQAINAASAGDTVYLCAGTYNINPRLTITKDLTFRGASEQTSILDGGDASQILYMPNQGSVYTVNVSNLTFRHGSALDESKRNSDGECFEGRNCGGAIYARGSGTLNLSDSYFHDNQSQFAGAVIIVEPKATNSISNSTFEHNGTFIDAGAILALGDAGGQTIMDRLTVFHNYIAAGPESRDATAVSANFGWGTLRNSTIVDNTEHPNGTLPTQLYGGGLSVYNTIVASSTTTDVRACNYVNMISGNLLTGASQNSCVSGAGSSIVAWDDLKLGALGYHGYNTQTMPLLVGSVAANNWDGADCTGSDQRGISVPQGAKCDAGAYERHASQGLNTPSTWSYGSSTLDRGPSSTFAVTSASTDPAGRGVTYSSDTPSVCTVNANSGMITAVSNGTCTLVATGEQYLLRDTDTRSMSVTITGTPGVTTTTVAPSTTAVTTTTVATTQTTASTVATTNATTATTVATTNTTATTAAVSGTATGASTGNTGTITTTTVKTGTTATTTALATGATVPETTVPVTTTTVPAPDAPAADPGEASATLDGATVDATVSRANNALVIDSGEVQVSVYGVTSTGERVALNESGDLVLQSGDSVAIEGSGYEPGSEVELWLRSTPVQLGVRTADADGKIAGSFTVPGTIEKGNHRVLFSGSTKSGSKSVVGVGVRVGNYEKVGGVNRGLIAGVIVVAITLALVIPTTTRRRRRATSNA